MAKIAGRKNDGAWFRMNRFLIKAQASVRTEFATQLMGLASFQPAFASIQNYTLEVGVGAGIFPTTMAAWAASLSLGIPRQIWDGVTTYDYYTKVPYDGGFEYIKQMQPPIFSLSKDVRELAKQFRFGNFEVSHLSELIRPAKGQSAEAAPNMGALDRQIERERITVYLMSPEGEAAVQKARAVSAARAEKKQLTSSADESISPVPRARTPRTKGRGRQLAAASGSE